MQKEKNRKFRVMNKTEVNQFIGLRLDKKFCD